MKRIISTLILTLSSLFYSMTAVATWQEASQEVEQTIEDMLVVIEKYRDQDPVDMEKLTADIELVVDRDVDFEYISKWVMGKYYRRAKPAERAKFAQVFKQTLIKTYAKSLLGFDIDKYSLVEAASKSPDDKKQIVSLDVSSKNGEIYSLVNYMVKRDEGWKLVNIIINGINLRITFKNQFADMMQRNKFKVGKVVDSWEAQIDSPVETKN